jgi:hypothetical protein
MATGRPSPIGPHPAGLGRQFPERVGVRITLDEHLPVDHRLSQVYRIGAGLMGLVLIAFGILGLVHKIGFFDTGGDTVAALNTNGALSVLSVVIGALLVAGMVIGGNFASTLNIVLGVAFLLSGFVNLALLETPYNFLAFRLQNVLFSFVVGLMLMWFGMYGRVSGGLPHDNPYWQARHPDLAEREAHARELQAGRGDRRPDKPPGTPPDRPPRTPPGKWGKLDQPPGTSPAPERPAPERRPEGEQREQRQEGRRHARLLLRRRRLSGGAPGSARPRPSA